MLNLDQKNQLSTAEFSEPMEVNNCEEDICQETLNTENNSEALGNEVFHLFFSFFIPHKK